VLPDRQANAIIDCMRAYGATTIGVVANVEPANPGGRDILGFISYGYAQALLRLGRIEEYILFLYAHRYHDHSRGSWTAGEVAGITGDGALFCIPAQQTIPLLVRWMLVFEDPDEDRLYFGRAIPRAWIASGKPISIEQAPTRWGRTDFSLVSRGNELVATVALPKKGELPREFEVSFRVPEGKKLLSIAANGQPVAIAGKQATQIRGGGSTRLARSVPDFSENIENSVTFVSPPRNDTILLGRSHCRTAFKERVRHGLSGSSQEIPSATLCRRGRPGSRHANPAQRAQSEPHRPRLHLQRPSWHRQDHHRPHRGDGAELPG
jgi:hypothetical protein